MIVKLRPIVYKQLGKIKKANPKVADKIQTFLKILESTIQPKALPNAKKMQGASDERYRFRVGEYRIIAIIKDNELIIEVIKIATRQGAYK